MLEIRGLTKDYGTRRVLDGVSFDVGRGRMTGFVGGNGAGKTTTMRIVLGVLDADAGVVSIYGRPLEPADRRRFGYMPEERGLYPKMRVEEQLVYLGRLHGLGVAAAARNARALVDRLGLGDRRGDAVEKLSLGNQQRAQIAAALVHEPDVLVLDEPFSGLDPLAVDVVVGVLSERARAGVPVLFSSHQLDLVERLCDDVVIISGGRIAASGSRDQLRDRHAGSRYRLAAADVGWIRDETGVEALSVEGGVATFEAIDEHAAQRVLRSALDRGSVAEFSRIRPTLSEIYKEVVG